MNGFSGVNGRCLWRFGVRDIDDDEKQELGDVDGVARVVDGVVHVVANGPQLVLCALETGARHDGAQLSCKFTAPKPLLSGLRQKPS